MRQVSSFLQPPASRPDPPGKVPEKTNCSEKSLLCSGKWEKWRKRNFFFVLSCRLALSPPSSPYSLNCDSKQVREEGKSFPKWFKTSPSISTDDDIMVREQTTFSHFVRFWGEVDSTTCSLTSSKLSTTPEKRETLKKAGAIIVNYRQQQESKNPSFLGFLLVIMMICGKCWRFNFPFCQQKSRYRSSCEENHFFTSQPETCENFLLAQVVQCHSHMPLMC